MSEKKVKKIKKQIVWALVDPVNNNSQLAGIKTRQDARDMKLSYEKIVRIEINGNNVSAKFVR